MAKSIGYVRTEAQSRWRNHLLVSAGALGGKRDDDVPCYDVTQYPHPRVERTINTERERVDTAAFGREVHKEVHGLRTVCPYLPQHNHHKVRFVVGPAPTRVARLG